MTHDEQRETEPLLPKTKLKTASQLSVNYVSNSTSLDSTSTEEIEEKSDWLSLWIAFVIQLIVAIQFSVYYSSLWPYISQIDETATESFYGYVVAIYSVGQLIGSPLFGLWSTRFQTTRLPVAGGVVLNIVSNVIYWFAEAFPTNRKWVVFFARFLIGFSAGNSSVLRAFVANSSSKKDRVQALSICTMFMSVGYIAGPGVQAIFSTVGYPAISIGPLHLNVYTCPSILAIGLAVINLILLFTVFREPKVVVKKHIDSESNSTNKPTKETFDKVAAGLCLWLWFAMITYYTVTESIGSPFTMAMFEWTKAQAVEYNGIIYSALGTIYLVVYATNGLLKSKVSLRVTILIGNVLMLSYFVVSFAYPNSLGNLHYMRTAESFNTSYANFTGNATVLSEPVGCPARYTWCAYTPKVHMAQYFVALLLGAIGYPLANVSVSVLYSLVVGRQKQGTMQGFLIMSGSFARIIGPFYASTTFEYYGPRVTWTITGIILSFTVVLCIALRHKLITPKH